MTSQLNSIVASYQQADLRAAAERSRRANGIAQRPRKQRRSRARLNLRRRTAAA
jgi:hypothetical protein